MRRPLLPIRGRIELPYKVRRILRRFGPRPLNFPRLAQMFAFLPIRLCNSLSGLAFRVSRENKARLFFGLRRLRARSVCFGHLLLRILLRFCHRRAEVIFGDLRVVLRRHVDRVTEPLDDYMHRKLLLQLRLARASRIVEQPRPRFQSRTLDDLLERCT